MLEAATNNEWTILDYLDEDCWRAVLDNVPVEEIVRTERASRRWQEVVLRYLRGIRIIIKRPPGGAPRPCKRSSWFKRDANVTPNNVCSLNPTGAVGSSFQNWTHKLGPSVVAACCDSVESMNIYENCPNLETLTLADLHKPEEIFLKYHHENFMSLRRLCLKNCPSVTDRVISQFMANNCLEELEIFKSLGVTGQWLGNKKTINLKSISLHSCYRIKKHHLLSADLAQLTKLQLSGFSRQFFEDIHLLLDKMPKLEYVTILSMLLDGGNLFKSVCRLRRLKALDTTFAATDADLAAVARSCPELRTLELRQCQAVTGRGLAAACAQAGARLERLTVARAARLRDDDVVACVYACPKLTELDLYACVGLSPGLPARAAAARRRLRARRPLRMRFAATGVHQQCCQVHST